MRTYLAQHLNLPLSRERIGSGQHNGKSDLPLPVGRRAFLTAEPEGDVLAAALIQISSHTERISALDAREASHYQEIADRLNALATDVKSVTNRIDGLGGTLSRQSAILDHLDGIDRQVAALAAQLAQFTDEDGGEQSSRYEPVPSPRWWKLPGPARDTALDRLRAWVDQIYRPSYGHIAAALPPCWEHHPLCLYTRLLAAAEQEATRRGCDQLALSTHSFQAPGFYARFGYQECGRTPAYPRGHDQIHLVKQLR